MSFLDKNGLQVLTTKLVQGDAIKVASHRGHTVKNVIDNITRECENISTPNTMNLENRINEFKVGKGRDVDVSGDVEEGKVEVELKGKTWQNVVPKMANGYVLSGSQSKIEDGIVYIKTNGKDHMQKYWTGSDIQLIKPNTTYTVISYIYENYLDRDFHMINNYAGKGGDLALTSAVVSRGYTGIYIGTFRTRESFEDAKRLGFLVSSNTNGTVVFSVPYILEGDHTQIPTEELPKYFEGIKSSFEGGVVEVEVVGKNLVSKATEWRLGVIDSNTGIYSDRPSGTRYTSNLIYNHSGKELYIRSKGQMWNYLYFYDENKNYLGFCTNQGMGSNYNFNINFDNSKRIAKYFIISFGNKDALEIGEVYEYRETDYITPYKKKISFNIGEPLRSLPNGVCDEIRNNNGQWELVRRVGKVVFNGSEGWSVSKRLDETILFEVGVPNIKIDKGGDILPICDKILPLLQGIVWVKDVESVSYTDSPNNRFRIRINKNRLVTQDLAGFKQWLSQNPTTVYYELETPTITPIEPIEFEVKPLATMTINSEIAPTSNHNVVLNRAGQIEQGIVQIAELKSRVDSLETTYDSYLLETQYKLSLLGFEYELESEEV